MAHLSEITVATSDLIAEKGDIENYLLGSETTFAVKIIEGKRVIFEEIKRHYEAIHSGETEAEVVTALALVKDKEEGLIKKKIVLTTIALIMRSNEMLPMFQEYNQYSKSVPLKYYIDENEDDVVDLSEEVVSPNRTLGR